MLSRCTDLLVTRQLGEAFQQFIPEGDFLQISVSHLVFGLYPGCRLCTGVVLQPTVGVAYFHTEVFIHGAVFLSLGVLQPLSLHHRSGHHCHTHQYDFLHVYMKILVRIQNLVQEIKIVEVGVIKGIPLGRFYAGIIINEILGGGTVAIG